MKKYSIENTKISKISAQKDFDINYPFCAPALEASIRKNGVLLPALAYEENGRYVLIDGFQRYRAAHTASLDSMPLQIIPTMENYESLIQLRYNLLISTSEELNVVQKARFFELIQKYISDPHKSDSWIQRLKLPPNSQISVILNWPDEAFFYLIKYNVSYNQIKLFFELSTEDVATLFELADTLSIRPVELIKISGLLSECALNEQTSVENILNSDEVNKILNNEENNRNQKLAQLKDAVFIRRFPMISKYREQMDALNKQLKAASFSLNYDKTFERSGLQLNAQIKNEKDLENIRKELAESANKEIILKMMNLV